jgi:hypothetical protein
MPPPKLASFIPDELFKASLKAHETNQFVKFLIDLFGVEVASNLVSDYFIATSKHWEGATVFWQIDREGKIRSGKIMLYSPATGKRVKEPFNHIQWVHKALQMPEFELRQCLFGEHLLKDTLKPVAIVESEKTAIIASVYLPEFIWLAVGSLTSLNAEKCSVLKGRSIVLFPDLNGFEKWSSKAKELSHLATFTVSDLLERKATEEERKQGFDIADYLIKFHYKAFALPEHEASTPAPAVQPKQLQPMDFDIWGEKLRFFFKLIENKKSYSTRVDYLKAFEVVQTIVSYLLKSSTTYSKEVIQEQLVKTAGVHLGFKDVAFDVLVETGVLCKVGNTNTFRLI